MSDHYTPVAHNTRIIGATTYNTNGTLTIQNTLTITNTTSMRGSGEGANNVKIMQSPDGLLEFWDVQGNKIRSRQRTLLLFVEKLIATGVAT